MKKLGLILCTGILAGMLAACSSSGTTGSTSSTGGSNETTAVAENKQAPTSSLEPAQVTVANALEGVEAFRNQVKELKRQVEANEVDPAIETTRQLLGIWAAIKGDFTASKPEVVQEIDNQLAELSEKVQADPWDTALLIKIDYQLYQEARKLE